eukprot:6183481-Pleurochrysis_carterae.AAC.8
MANNFGTPPLAFSIVAGQTVRCASPFVSAKKGLIVPMPDEPTMVGTVLGCLVGEEQWTQSKGNKKKREYRRFALIDYVLCGIPSITPAVGDCRAACWAAARARKPGSVHNALMTAQAKASSAGLRRSARAPAQRPIEQPPIDADAAVDSAASAATPGPTRGTDSGIPLGICGWGEAKLLPFASGANKLAKLLLALAENAISPPLAQTEKKHPFFSRASFRL